MPQETFYVVGAGDRDDGGHEGEAQECRVRMLLATFEPSGVGSAVSAVDSVAGSPSGSLAEGAPSGA